MIERKQITDKKDLLYPELSYIIVGCAFDVFNELGSGLREQDYQKAMAVAMKKAGLAFREQVYLPLKYQNELLVKAFADFVVEEKVVVELKKANYFGRTQIQKLMNYLKAGKHPLGIILNFGTEGVRHKRIVNLRP